MKRFLFVPGLPRCATTSFVQLLDQHEGIFLPKIKEPHFFLPAKENYFMFDRKGRHIPFKKSGFVNSYDEFLANYDGFTENKIFIDGSTLYAVHTNSIDEIARQQDIDPYFIILKRDPFKRAVSHYLYSVSRGEEYRKFDQALHDEQNGKFKYWLLGGYIAGSDSKQCEEKIKKYWGAGRLIVADIDKDDIFSSLFMEKVLSFLGLPSFNFDFNTQANALTYTENPVMKEIRIVMKKVRQLNPSLVDNKITRPLFEKFMKSIPVNKDVYAEYESYRSLYEDMFQKHLQK